MKKTCIACTALALFIISCSKNNPNSVQQNAQDTLHNWKKITVTKDKPIIDIWFTSASTGFIIANSFIIYQTKDGGYSWDSIPATRSASPLINLFFQSPQYGFAQSTSYILFTGDGGETWVRKPIPTQGALTFSFPTPSTGFYNDIVFGLYKTTDTGNNWINVYHDPNGQAQVYNSYFIDDMKGFVITGLGTVAKTDDGGASWIQKAINIISPAINSDEYDLMQFVDSLTGYFPCQYGLFKTTDGGITWNNIFAKGGRLNIIKALDMSNAYYMSDSAIYKTTDGGKTWTTDCRLGAESFLSMSLINVNTGWACTSKGSVLKLGQ
ncbi:MAG TPA: YCF48-related protein [Puia sp.]|nr:YCF48-related protein [Puia sp.]